LENKSLLVIISDTHIGGSTALATPEYGVHNRYDLEAQTMRANRLQSWLWECWVDFWNYVYELQGKGKKARRLIVVHCGDVIDGVHNGSTQLMPEIADQMQLALDILQPVASRANAFFGIYGTGAHAGNDNVYEAQLYTELGAQAYGHQLTLDIDGYIHSFQHHGRSGARPWTSSAAGLASEVMIDYAQRGQKPPNFIWTGHLHRVDDSGVKFKETRAISLPSWQLKSSFSWKVAGNSIRSDIGGFIVLDGHIIDNSHARYVGQADERDIIKV
jgi:hypothetical protein